MEFLDLRSMELARCVVHCYPFTKLITKLYHSCNIIYIDDGLFSLGNLFIEIFMISWVI
jgi:hypothetical protein